MSNVEPLPEPWTLTSLAEDPSAWDAWWDVDGAWPEFMQHDPVADRWYVAAMHRHPRLHLLVRLGGLPAARVHAVPIPWSSPEELPVRGWDWVLEQAVDAPVDDLEAVSLVEIRLQPELRGRGLSHRVLAAVRERFESLGVRHLVGPVRPNGKADEPETPIDEYARRTRVDGLPVDAWLRVHVRAGGRILAPAPLSMTIPGTLAQWRSWTGMPFDASGTVVVPGALTPVHVDVAADHACYVEPNVWVHHRL